MRQFADDTGPSGRRRLLRAFLVAPLAAPAGYSAGLALLGLTGVLAGRASIPSIGSLVDVAGMIAAIGVPVAYAAAFVGAAPVYFVLRRLGIVSTLTLLMTGTTIGVVVAVLLAPRLKGELFSIPFPIWVGALLGLLCADVFRRLLSTRGT
jgi:hypothetical protein